MLVAEEETVQKIKQEGEISKFGIGHRMPVTSVLAEKAQCVKADACVVV